MSRKKKEEPLPDVEVQETEFTEWDSDGFEYDMFDAEIDVIPSFLEPIPYKKLNNDIKTALKQMWEEYVEDYWEEEHQIPLGNDFNLLMAEMVGIFEEAENTLIKVDKSLRHALQEITLTKINKILEFEYRKHDE